MTALTAQAPWQVEPAPRLVLPAVYRCALTHTRRQGTRHTFTYAVYLWLVDVDALPRLPWPLARLTGFRARDHLGQPGQSLRVNLDAYLEANGVHLGGGRILMLAQPHVLGYAFDPVTFFVCYDFTGQAACLVLEVRNTFGERHCYLIRSDGDPQRIAKQLYVSPYFPLDGHYRIRFTLGRRGLRAAITLHRAAQNGAAEEPALTVVLDGTRLRTPASVANWLLRPQLMLAPWRTALLIRLQARRLHRRGLAYARRRAHTPQPGVDVAPQAQTVCPAPRRDAPHDEEAT